MPANIPINDSIPMLKFPDFQIENYFGIKFYFFEDNEQDIFKVRLLNRAGSAAESLPGLSDITHSYLLYGFLNHSYEDISDLQEKMGASLNSFSQKDIAGIELTALAEYQDKAVELFKKCYFTSNFPELELEHIKKQQIANINHYRVEPSFLANYAASRAYYASHTYSQPSFGTVDSIQSLDTSQIKSFYDNYVKKYQTAIFISGKFNKDKILKDFEGYFNNENNDKLPIADRFLDTEMSKIAVINKSNAVQANLEIISRGVDIKHPDHSAVKIANLIFGGFFMSKLNEIIREKHGFTYGIHSQFRNRYFSDEFTISSSLNIENLKKSIDLINEIKHNYANNPITEEELMRAKAYFLGNFNNNLESHIQISSLLRSLFIMNLPKNYYDNLFDHIKNLTVEDVFAVQKKYFNPEKQIIAVSGDLTLLTEQLKELGEVTEITPDF